MDNPGVLPLGDFTISAAGTQNGVPVCDLEGMLAVTLQVRFAYGAGGTKTNVFIVTSLDQGASWVDVANFAFTTASGVGIVNLSALDKVTAPIAPTYLTLADNMVVDGVLGDRLQAVVVSAGVYSNQTQVSVRGVAR